MFDSKSRTGQAFWLGIGSLVSFSFGIVSAAILSRLLSVDEYGTYRQVLYVYSTLLIVFTLGMPRAYSFFLARLPIEQGKKSVDKINSIFLLLGSIFSVFLFLGADMIGTVLKNPALPSCIRSFALTPIFLLPVLGIESVMTTYKKASYATIYVILSRLFNLICVVLPVMMFKGGANDAVIGFTVSSAICCVIGLYIERKPFVGIESQKTTLSIVSVLRYSLPLLFASLWAIVINSSPQFFISRWYGTEAFAEFANGFIELPFAGMVISAVATVLLPEISRLSKDESNLKNILDLWRSSFEKSAKIIYPVAIFACVFASQIIEVLYGSKYVGAVIYFQIILSINLIRVVPYAPIMMGLDMGHKYAAANFVPAVLVVMLDFFWVNLFPYPLGIAIIQCICILIHVIVMLYYISKKLSIKISELIPFRISIKILLVSVFSSAVVCSLRNLYLYEFSILQLSIEMILFLMIYLTICYYIKIDYKCLWTSFLHR